MEENDRYLLFNTVPGFLEGSSVRFCLFIYFELCSNISYEPHFIRYFKTAYVNVFACHVHSC